MAYAATGTAGNDTLNQSSDTGPGTIVGLAGDDMIFTGSGLATVTGDSGNDTVLLRTGNTGTVNGGTENDSHLFRRRQSARWCCSAATAPIPSRLPCPRRRRHRRRQRFERRKRFHSARQRADIVFGNGGNDIVRLGIGFGGGNDTIVGGFGNDSVSGVNNGGDGAQLFSATRATTRSRPSGGNDTAFLGLGNDSVHQFAAVGGGSRSSSATRAPTPSTCRWPTPTWRRRPSSAATTPPTAPTRSLGGPSRRPRSSATAAPTRVNASRRRQHRGRRLRQRLASSATTGNDLVFGNESNDTSRRRRRRQHGVRRPRQRHRSSAGAGRDTLQGNEDNDTIRGDLGGGISIDTIAGGSGNDVFAYLRWRRRRQQCGGRRPGRVHHRSRLVGGPLPDRRRRSPSRPTPAPAPAPTSTRPPTTRSPRPSRSPAAARSTWRRQFTFGGRTYVAIEPGRQQHLHRLDRPARRHHRRHRRDRDEQLRLDNTTRCRPPA